MIFIETNSALASQPMALCVGTRKFRFEKSTGDKMHRLKLLPVSRYGFQRSVSLCPREENIGSTGFFEDDVLYRVVNRRDTICLLKMRSADIIEQPEIHAENTHPIDEELRRRRK